MPDGIDPAGREGSLGDSIDFHYGAVEFQYKVEPDQALGLIQGHGAVHKGAGTGRQTG